jgi:hypothetical protein
MTRSTKSNIVVLDSLDSKSLKAYTDSLSRPHTPGRSFTGTDPRFYGPAPVHEGHMPGFTSSDALGCGIAVVVRGAA